MDEHERLILERILATLGAIRTELFISALILIALIGAAVIHHW